MFTSKGSVFKWLGAAAMAALLTPPGASAQLVTSYFKLSSQPDFARYRPVLVDYLRSQHYGKATGFCLFGTRDDGGVTATVIWPDGQQIIDWGGNDSPLAESTSILHLKTDVVPTEKDIRGSTYLVTRQWVADRKALCKQYGETVRISAADLR